MTNLFDYPFLVNEVFYRGHPILTWIEKQYKQPLWMLWFIKD